MADTDYDQVLKAFQDQRKRRTEKRSLLGQWIFGMQPGGMGMQHQRGAEEWGLGIAERYNDPTMPAKVLGTAMPAGIFDLAGMAQQGGEMLITGETGNLPGRISGDPLRRAVGYDPEDPQALAGEIAGPDVLSAALKGLVVGGKFAKGALASMPWLAAQIKKLGKTGVPVTVRGWHGTNAEFDLADMNMPAMFSTNREYAEQLAQGPGGRVIEADITLENPADLRAMDLSPSDPEFAAIAEELKAAGYDGAQYRDEAYIAFYPNQIRQIDQAAGETTYSGPAFRYEPGFEGGAPPGSTVGDVLAEEMSRKGVDDLEGFGIDPATYESIKDLPADAVTWVGRDANRMMQEYGPTDDWAGLLSSPDELSDVTDQVAGGRILYEDESGALILRPDAPPSKGTLSAQFLGRDDKFWDIGEDAYGQAEFRKSGHSPVSCTGYACEIQEKLGQERVTVMGFDGESNPGSAISEIADGHDFAVVDGRYIVDPWVTDVEDIGKGAYDMTDPADAAEIRRLYGDPKTWERAGPDASTQDAPAFKMTRLSVGEMKYPWAGREWDVVPAGQADLALNPGREDVVKAFGDRDVRFMVDDMQNLYVWPSDQALHGQVLDALKINRDEVELYSDQIVPASELYDWLDHWDGAGEFGSGPYQSWRPKTLDAEAAAGPGIPDDVMSMLQSNIDALGPARASMFTIADLNRAQQIYDPAHAAAEPQSRRMVDIAKDLQEEALQAWGGSPMEFTPENASIVADNMTKEAIESLKHRPDMAGWYKGNLSEAMGHASSIYPELATDPHAETAFKLIMAITSNGKEVEENAKITNRLYQQYRKTGQFPIFGSGKEKGAMEGAFRLANKLVDEWGFDEFTTFLNKEFTVRELKEAGFNISGELMDTVLNGSVIFGPKVGGGFFQNLTGNYNPATFDLWWTRTFGRHTATALHPEAKIAKQRAALREAIGRKRKFIEDLGFDPKAIKTDDEQLDELARVLNAKFAAGGHKDKNPINNASRNLMTSVGKTREAPSGGGERNFMRDVIGQVQKNLSGAGIDLDIADIQALLWYTEQDLYLKMGGKVDTTKKDYATVWKEIAEAYRAGQ